MNPVILIDKNLRLEHRYRTKNILLVILIPGLKKHILVDTFLWPLVQEIKKLDNGINRVYNAYTKDKFRLRAWIDLCCGDGPTKADILGMMNLGNAICPCLYCKIIGVRGT
jgi:Transposase family tnp2